MDHGRGRAAHPFVPNTPEDQRRMLAAIGAASLDKLFSDIPREVLERYRPLGLEPLTEPEVERLVKAIAGQNADPDEYISFLGGGVYDHYVPSVVQHLLLRPEFFTTYTPYQAELSQGTLTWMFEFQTMVCELTGMEVANSSMYDGATALAEAVNMARAVTGRRTFLVARSLNPYHRRVLETYAWGFGTELVEVPYDAQGRLDRDVFETYVRKHRDALGGLLVQSPNFFGVIEDLSGLKDPLGEAFLIVGVHPLSLGVLRPPGAYGADVVVGEGQVLGNPPNFGGPLLGLFATRQRYVRRMPGRLAGRTLDAEGRTGYVMALQTREQHIRRAKATSNICTNQALCALAATIYLALLGRQGLRRLGALLLQKAHYLAERICQLEGFSLAFEAPFFTEFAVRVPGKPAQLLKDLRARKILGGLDLEPYVERGLLVAVTEKRSREELDRFVEALREVASLRG